MGDEMCNSDEGRSRRRGSAGAKVLAALLALAMLAAACGSDGSTDEAGSTTTADGATTTAGGGDDPDAPATTGAEATPVSGTCDATRTLTWGFDYSINTWDPHNSPAGNDQKAGTNID